MNLVIYDIVCIDTQYNVSSAYSCGTGFVLTDPTIKLNSLYEQKYK